MYSCGDCPLWDDCDFEDECPYEDDDYEFWRED